jgi:hypothetical protein
MPSYPSAKVHRVSRRQLGRGQHVQLPQAAIVATVATVTVTLTFSVPVIVSGRIGYVGNTGPVLTQTQTSPTVVALTFAATQAAATYSIAANDPAIKTFQGGGNAAVSGTF